MKEFALFPTYLFKLFADAWPSKVTLGVLAVIVEYVFPKGVGKDMALGAGILICVDTLTGVLVAVKTKRAVTSAKLSRFLMKILAYSSVVVVVAVAIRNLGLPTEVMGWIIGGVIATEGLSILENVARMGFKLPFGLQDLLKERLKSYLDHQPETSKEE